MHNHANPPTGDTAIDPVCGMTVEPENAAANRSYEDQMYFFCSTYCADEFDAHPTKYVAT